MGPSSVTIFITHVRILRNERYSNDIVCTLVLYFWFDTINQTGWCIAYIEVSQVKTSLNTLYHKL